MINTQFTQPLTVLVTDAGSNPVQGVTVTYVANGTTANASLSAASAVTDSDGFASVIATANGTTGSYTVTAAAGSVGSVNFALRNSAAATSTSLAPPTQTVIYGNTINFTATVNQPAATGSVDFFLGTELLGSRNAQRRIRNSGAQSDTGNRAVSSGGNVQQHHGDLHRG